MLGETRRSRVGVLWVTVAASVLSTGALVASCLDRGQMHRAKTAAEAGVSAQQRALATRPSTTTTTSSEVGPYTTMGLANAIETEALGEELAEAEAEAARARAPRPEVESDTSTTRPEAPEGSVTGTPPQAAMADRAQAIADTLDRTAATLARVDEAEANRTMEGAAATPDEGAETTRESGPARPTPEERQRAVQFAAGTPTVAPRFDNVGAGAFLTEPPLWSASAMTSDPSAGAGPFTTETTISPSIIYSGVPALPAGAAPFGGAAGALPRPPVPTSP